MYRNSHRPDCGCGCKKRPAVQPIAQQPIARPHHHVQPIVCPPLCRYTDSYTQREVPYIQPLININRQHIVDVPKTYYEEINQNVVVSPAQNQNPFGGRNRYPRC